MNPIVDFRIRIQRRRYSWIGHIPENQLFTYKIDPHNNNGKMLMWIDNHTSGPFYLGGNKIGFTDSRDAVMFKLGFKD